MTEYTTIRFEEMAKRIAAADKMLGQDAHGPDPHQSWRRYFLHLSEDDKKRFWNSARGEA